MIGRPKVLVAQPIYGWVPADAAISFARMVASGTKAGVIESVGQTSYGILSQARNILLKELNQQGQNWFTHVMFVDADMVVPHDIVQRLAARKVPIVSGMYFMRRAPYLPVAIPKDHKEEGGDIVGPEAFAVDYQPGLNKMAAVGMGCCLIEAEVINAIEAKWKDQKWFSFEQNEGEDLWFCRRARQLGYSVYLDADVQCGHVGDHIVDETTYLDYKAKHLPAAFNKHGSPTVTRST
jgi:hypothetical protein